MSDPPPPVSLKSGKYDVERVLGRGGMGTVFQARHTRLGHPVAIKMLATELCAYPELGARFEREARAAGALSSPHAVRVFDIDTTDDGVPFMVMELLAGRDLGQVLEASGPPPIGAAVRWIIEACDAIAEAHRLGIVHRDIKPSNLLLCDGTGAVKVLDFGIAKHVASKDAAITGDVVPLGTPQYMSPEQARCARDVDARTDIWSLGATLYELLTGHPPFDHEAAQACIAALVADPVLDPRELRPEIPEELSEVVFRTLEKSPRDRYQSVAELVHALAPFADRPSVPELGSWSLTIDTAHHTGVRTASAPDLGPARPVSVRVSHEGDETMSAPPSVVTPRREAGLAERVARRDLRGVLRAGRRTPAATRKLGSALLSAALVVVAAIAPPSGAGAHVDARTDIWSLGASDHLQPVAAREAADAAMAPPAAAPPPPSAEPAAPDPEKLAVALKPVARRGPSSWAPARGPSAPRAESSARKDTSSKREARPVATTPAPAPRGLGVTANVARPVHGGISNPGF